MSSQLKKQLSLDVEYLAAQEKIFQDIFTHKKLLLHFDQHNTIQVACNLPTRKVTVEEGINNFLTSVLWGKEIDNKWEWLSTEPHLYKPKNEPDAITYFKYLEKKIVKSPADRVELKTRTCKFVYEEPGSKFREFFDLYLKKLTYSDNWECEDIIEVENGESLFMIKSGVKEYKLPPNTIPDNDDTTNTLYHLILPDFFDMIRRLQKDKRNFAIILRTMGIDSKNFLETVKPVIEAKHRDFKDLLPIKINPNVGEIIRDKDDRIELRMDNEIYSNEEEIYKKLNSLEGINAIRDDFAFWQKSDYECYAAKPLWINLEDGKHQHILFDDNIRLDAIDDCIVNIRLNNSLLNEYENVDFASYATFEKSSILQPNLIELLNPHLKRDSNKNHYYEKIRKAELMYHKLITNKSSLKISTIKNDELDSSSDLSKLDKSTNKNEKGEEICEKIVINQNNKKLIIEQNESDHNNSNGTSGNIKQLKKKISFVDLKKSFKSQLEKEEKEIDEQDKTISTVCNIQ